MDYEIGSFSDNAAILAIAARAVEQGAVEEALPVLRDLRDRMEDTKSRRWLLPEVNRLIDAAEATGVRRHVRKPRRQRRKRTRSLIARLEPMLVRIAALASLSATIVRIVVHEVLGVLSPRP
jgi:hypothetical protein